MGDQTKPSHDFEIHTEPYEWWGDGERKPFEYKQFSVEFKTSQAALEDLKPKPVTWLQKLLAMFKRLLRGGK